MLLGFPLNNVIENKVIIKEPLISFVDLILKILEFFALACWSYDISLKTMSCIWESGESHLRFRNVKWGIIQYWKYVKWNSERHQHNTIMTHQIRICSIPLTISADGGLQLQWLLAKMVFRVFFYVNTLFSINSSICDMCYICL